MSKARVDLLVHLRLSDDGSGTAAEREALFKLDEAIDGRFGDEYDGNDIGEGEFLIHLVPRTDPEALLTDVVSMIPGALVRVGSYAVIRTAGRDEDSERIVPLAGEPAVRSELKERKPLSFGMAVGGEAPDNRALLDYLKAVWKRIREIPDRSGRAGALIVIWHIGGDISSPDELRERVKIEIRSERVLGSTIEIPLSVAATTDPATLVREALIRVLEKAETLVKRRKLDWDLAETARVVSSLSNEVG